MSAFNVPYSSSPPSTPDRRTQGGSQQYSFGSSNLSTTPAGLPPSSAGSFTPAGPPPSSIFGSSRLDSSAEKPFQPLKITKHIGPSRPKSYSSSSRSYGSNVRSAVVTQRSGLSNEIKLPSPTREFQDESDESDDVGDEIGDAAMEEVDRYADQQFGGEYDLDEIERIVEDMEDERYEDERYQDERYDDDQDMLQFNSSIPSAKSDGNGYNMSQQSALVINSASPQQSREDDMLDIRTSIENAGAQQSQDSSLGRIARDIYTQMGSPRVNEADDLVLNTEELIKRLYDEGVGIDDDNDRLNQALAIIPSEILKLWEDYNTRTLIHVSEEYVTAIGPGPGASKFAHAYFLASLFLSLHHPSVMVATIHGSQPMRASLMRGSVAVALDGKIKPLPLILLEWMDNFHDPYPRQLTEIQAYKPSPSNHRLFWDVLLNGILRGKIVAVVNTLRHAGWKYARSATDDARQSSEEVGYSGMALATIEKIINDAVEVLSQCPAMRGDWDIRNGDWTLFRLRISQALETLKRFAEGRDGDWNTSAPFQADNFGVSSMSNGGQSYKSRAKQAESRVPWNIYQNLVTMYNLILGDENAIIENSQDWCEATVGLLVWWSPDKHDRRMTLRSSRRHGASGDSVAYFQRLADAFYIATADSTDFYVNTLDAVEIGLACIFESDIEAVLGILRAYSGPVSSAVAEIASLGGWLPRTEQRSLITMESLDQDDMEVLGLGPRNESIDGLKDHTLIVYADGLAQRGQLELSIGAGRQKRIRDGWEIAIEVLGRLDSAQRSEEKVGQMLKDVPRESSAIVDKLWRILNDLSMMNHAETIAEEYADSLAEDTYKYGEALWYYALAHKPKKVKDVLDLLISFSLIYSVAYPPEAELDDHLRRVLSSPTTSLMELSKMDFEAAKLLHKMLSGYATLRKFYDIRDQEVNTTEEKKRQLSDVQTREATAALMAVISSSDDNIRGGLYDESRGAVVSVDFLLALLGEAMVFVNKPNSCLTPSQIDTLLKAVEDVQTIPANVFGPCKGFFETVIASKEGMTGSTPMDLLKKTTSSLSGTSSFSMVGSSIVASQLHRSMGSSGILVKGNIKRGWDWRKALKAGITGEEVLQVLRYGLAKELARVWLLEADGLLGFT